MQTAAHRPEERLDAVRRLADELGAAHLAADASALASRLAEGRFYVACLGQFKRGKSTLINAMVGRELLPVGVVPVTSAIAVVAWGEEENARVRFLDGRSELVGLDSLAAFATEASNPGNAKGVAVVEIRAPAALLAGGVSLVDTPGLGAVQAANSEVTKRFVPHIDAAIVVLGADPPISGDELKLVEEVAAQIDHVLFVLAKADRVTEHERAEAVEFTAGLLRQRLGREPGRIYQVSGLERLQTGSATRDWNALTGALDALARDQRADLISAAEDRGIERLLRALLHELEEQRAALVRPLAESEARLTFLRTCVADAERALNDLAPLFAAEQQRILRVLERRREDFLREALPAVAGTLAAHAGAEPAEGVGKLRQRLLLVAQEIARTKLEQWRAEMEPEAERLYSEATARFATVANDFLVTLSTMPGMDGLPRAIDPGYRTRARIVLTDLLHLTSRSAGKVVMDLLRWGTAARAAALRDASEYLSHHIESNSSRVAYGLDERMTGSRRVLEQQIRSLLRDVLDAADRALVRARLQHRLGADGVRDQLQRLDAIRAEIANIVPPGLGRSEWSG